MTDPPPNATLILAAVVAVTFTIMLILERVRALRPAVEPKLRHVARNLTVGAFALAVGTLAQAPLLAPVSRWITTHRAGLLQQVSLPPALTVVIAIVLLDYTLFLWHWASHRVPFLWRFHLVHHVDRDLDSSTALRFHFGEHALSIAYRAVQIVVIGVTPFELWLWQTILFVSILFHHANVELPPGLDRVLIRVLVTPRMHGIHHSNRESHTNSNWSSLIPWWDSLHGTLKLDVPQTEVTIGVPAYARPEDVTLGKILALAFMRQRESWKPR